MWIVAIAALHFAIAYRMNRSAGELGLLFYMTLVTTLSLAALRNNGILPGVYFMAIHAQHILLLVRTTQPFHPVIVLVTLQALIILLFPAHPGLAAKTDNRRPLLSDIGLLRMSPARPVAGLALQLRHGSTWIVAITVGRKKYGKHRKFIVFIVTLKAGIRPFSGVFFNFLRGRRRNSEQNGVHNNW